MSYRVLAIVIVTMFLTTTPFSATATAEEAEPTLAWDSRNLPGGEHQQCMYRYWEIDAGVVRYVSSDSCSSALWVDPSGAPIAWDSGAASVAKCYGTNPRYCVDLADRCQVRGELVGIAGTDTWAYCVEPTNADCPVSREWTTWWGDAGRDCVVGDDTAANEASVGVPVPCAVRKYGSIVGAGCWIGTGTLFWVAAGKDASGNAYCAVTIGVSHYECIPGGDLCGKVCDNCITDGTCDPCWGCFQPAAAPAGGPGQCMDVYREYDLGAVRIVMRDTCHTEVYVLGENVKDLLA